MKDETVKVSIEMFWLLEVLLAASNFKTVHLSINKQIQSNRIGLLLCVLQVVLQEHHQDRSWAAAEAGGVLVCLDVQEWSSLTLPDMLTVPALTLVFQDREGGFVVRESSQRGVYTVSVYTKTLRWCPADSADSADTNM